MLPEVEVRLEDLRLERDGALVECLRLGDLVARVVDVGEIDQRRHEVRDRSPAPGGTPSSASSKLSGIAIVEDRGRDELRARRTMVLDDAAAGP